MTVRPSRVWCLEASASRNSIAYFSSTETIGYPLIFHSLYNHFLLKTMVTQIRNCIPASVELCTLEIHI